MTTATKSKLDVKVQGDRLHIGNATVTFHRTLRIPDDGKQYPLPPGLGYFPIRRVEDYAARVPEAWNKHGGVFLPMYQREAMWLGFGGNRWPPNALKVAIGKVNALSGLTWSEKLQARGKVKQDYMVIPDQPWLDGINAGEGFIKQFVAMPLGMGYTVEGQVTGKEKFGGLQLCVFEPKVGKFPDRDPRIYGRSAPGAGGQHASSALYASFAPQSKCMAATQDFAAPAAAAAGAEMGLAAGGRMKQSIYPDTYGIDTWEKESSARVYVHLVNSLMWTHITGESMPDTPVSAKSYTDAGYRWFDLYDEPKGDIDSSKVLESVKSVKEMDKTKGIKKQQDDSSVKVKNVHTIGSDPTAVKDGKW